MRISIYSHTFVMHIHFGILNRISLNSDTCHMILNIGISLAHYMVVAQHCGVMIG